MGWDRQRDLRCIHGIRGSQVDCPVCPHWYGGTGLEVYTRYARESSGLSCMSILVQWDGIDRGTSCVYMVHKGVKCMSTLVQWDGGT